MDLELAKLVIELFNRDFYALAALYSEQHDGAALSHTGALDWVALAEETVDGNVADDWSPAPEYVTEEDGGYCPLDDTEMNGEVRLTYWQHVGSHDHMVEAVYVGGRLVRHAYTNIHRAHQ